MLSREIVAPDLAGETVVLWWGLFDNELYVEHQEQRYGPYIPAGGPIPLHRYRQYKKTRTQQRADRIETLAKQLVLPKHIDINKRQTVKPGNPCCD